MKFSKSPRTVTLKSRRPVTLSWVNLPVRGRKRVTLTWANLPIRSKVLVVVAIPLCALLAAAVAYYVDYRADLQAERWVVHAQDVRTDIQGALIFLLDAETGKLSYSNAGHNYPLLLRSNGNVEQLQQGSGKIIDARRVEVAREAHARLVLQRRQRIRVERGRGESDRLPGARHQQVAPDEVAEAEIGLEYARDVLIGNFKATK